MAAEVVSLARPGSSDGGSAPQLIVISWLAALVPPSSVVSPVPAASPPSSSSPPQPAATKARLATNMARSSQKVFVLMWSVLSRGRQRASRWGAFFALLSG